MIVWQCGATSPRGSCTYISIDPQCVGAFDKLRELVNLHGGIAEQFLRQPYGGVPFAHLDSDTDAAFRVARVPVPPLLEFLDDFVNRMDPAERRERSVRLAMQLLTDNETVANWAEELVPLLHARSA